MGNLVANLFSILLRNIRIFMLDNEPKTRLQLRDILEVSLKFHIFLVKIYLVVQQPLESLSLTVLW